MVNVHEKYSGVDSYPYNKVMLNKFELDPLKPSEPNVYIFWPECCALCLGEVTGYRKVTGSGSSLVGDTIEEMTLEVQVPYCSECKKKVRRIFRREEEAVHIYLGVNWRYEIFRLQLNYVEVGFRNAEYAKRFVLVNSTIADDRHLSEPKKKVARKRSK